MGEGRIFCTYEGIQKNDDNLNLYCCDNCSIRDNKQQLITKSELCLHDNHIRCSLCCDAASKLEQYFEGALDDITGEEF